jgi:hypothetical protein
MKIKILQDCQSAGFDYKANEIKDLPPIGTEKQVLLTLVSMGFAKEEKESKATTAEPK